MPAATPQTTDWPRRLFRARIAVSAAFLIMGIGTGVWATHIPLIQARLVIDPGILGLALFVMAFGAITTMPLAGMALARFGSRPPAAAMVVAFTVLMPLPILAGSVPAFFIGALLFGMTMGALDVSMNLQATEIEAARGQPSMSSFHGFFSIGGLCGAGLGAAVIAAGWGDGSGATLLAAFLLVVAVAGALNLWPSAAPPEAGPRFVLPNRAAFALGVLAFLCFAIEGAVTDWSALYLATVKQASVAEAATGFAAFSIAMAVLRLAGDAIVTRLGEKRTVVGGGVLIACGMALAIVAPIAALSAAGFALVGIGAANVVPVVFGAASRTPGMPSSLGVAAVATLGYAGFLTMPPILGFVARAWGLSASLAIVAAMGFAVAAIAVRQTMPSRGR